MDRFYNAQSSIEVARTTLAQVGECEAAEVLRGLEVYSHESAEVALDAIRAIKTHTRDGQCARMDALLALELAVGYHQSRLSAVA